MKREFEGSGPAPQVVGLRQRSPGWQRRRKWVMRPAMERSGRIQSARL